MQEVALVWPKQIITIAPRRKAGASMRKPSFQTIFPALRTVCVLLLACATAIGAAAQTFTTILTFDGTDGSAPYSALVQGTDGNLYGTTSNGGATGRGTVFKVTPGGTLSTLYNFCSEANCVDGSIPQAGLVLGVDGNFYGTTMFGGTGTTYCGSGCGTVFQITPTGAFTTLHSFCTLSTCLDGYAPNSGLVQGTDGNFYGTTPNGGGPSLQGTVYKITPGGSLTPLHAFCTESGCADGETPLAGLIQGSNGVFYGTTSDGGAHFDGEVFGITSAGAFSIVHSFDETDGGHPSTGLLQAANSEGYGMTQDGGTSTACSGNPCGTIFRISGTGVFTSLVSFDNTDGADPEYGGLIQGSDGNLYGTTAGGGSHEAGTILKMTPSGTLTTLYNFCSVGAECADGSGVNSVMQSTNGIFYGTTAGGGTTGDGTLFSLSTGARRFVQPVPTSGAVGSTVMILGNNLTGATGVKFNATAAAFTVVSSTEITATVPSGATSGKITVTGSSGSVTSVVAFRVR